MMSADLARERARNALQLLAEECVKAGQPSVYPEAFDDLVAVDAADLLGVILGGSSWGSLIFQGHGGFAFNEHWPATRHLAELGRHARRAVFELWLALDAEEHGDAK